MRGVCSICSAASDIVATVNGELLKPPGERMNLRELERVSGFSRSSLSRHSRNCVPMVRLTLNRDKTALSSGRLITKWPNGTHTWWGDAISEADITPNDIVLAVQYEAPVTIHTAKNPQALLTDELLEEAFAENAERNGALTAPAE